MCARSCKFVLLLGLVASTAQGLDLRTISRFEDALYEAHDKADLTYFEPLVASVGAQPALVEETYHSFGARFDYEIRRMNVSIYLPAADDPKPRWNIQPEYTLEVWYALDRTQPEFSQRYVLGRVNGQFQIAVRKDRIHLALFVVRPTK